MTTGDVRVLIVDDQPPFREVSRMVVDMTDGFLVVGEASSGAEALDMIDRLRPDLVLMDVQMPGMDGIETTRRARARTDAPAVVVLSTYDTADYASVAAAAGAVAFIPKSEFGIDALTDVWRLAGSI